MAYSNYNFIGMEKNCRPIPATVGAPDGPDRQQPAREDYVAPVMEIVEVKVEQGFATSAPNWGPSNPW